MRYDRNSPCQSSSRCWCRNVAGYEVFPPQPANIGRYLGSTPRRSNHNPRHLTLSELEQSKTSVLNTLSSMQSRRSYQHAMNEFIAWYCSEPRLALNRIVVPRYRMHLENIPLAPATINLRLAAIRRLAYEASDNGFLSPELVACIRRVKGVKRLGQQVGNRLTAEEGQQLVGAVRTDTLRGKQAPLCWVSSLVAAFDDLRWPTWRSKEFNVETGIGRLSTW